MKTSELSGAALDWAVAKCESALPASFADWSQRWPKYSTEWGRGGPIMDRERINTAWNLCADPKRPNFNWMATCPDKGMCVSIPGPTMLIAAMRCYVASKLGNTVDIPEELK
jgi:hypothetical protein